MQGSGTFALESALGSVVDRPSRLLILSNGAYGDRLAELAERLRLAPVVRRVPETAPLDPADIAAICNEQPQLTHLAFVHCETSTGRINPLPALCAGLARLGCRSWLMQWAASARRQSPWPRWASMCW